MPDFDGPLFEDALFRQKRKQGKWRIVSPPEPPLEAPVADTHAHLQLLRSPSLALARAGIHNVRFIGTVADICEDGLTTFAELDTWLQEAARLIGTLAGSVDYPCPGPLPNSAPHSPTAPVPLGSRPPVPRVRIIAGCHPHNARHYSDSLEALLTEQLADPRVGALGEVGLDYHYDFSPRKDQRTAFRRQIRLAHTAGLPLVLHLREAHDEGLAIMEEEGFPQAGVLLHCFNLDAETLVPWLAHGCFVAFGGPLTFKKSDEVRHAAGQVPEDHLLTETDAPFMAPEPLRGSECGPEHTVFTAACLAQVHGCEPGSARQRLLEQLYGNALGLLDRPPTRWQSAAAPGPAGSAGASGAPGETVAAGGADAAGPAASPGSPGAPGETA